VKLDIVDYFHQEPEKLIEAIQSKISFVQSVMRYQRQGEQYGA
jgi:hypothetical protein